MYFYSHPLPFAMLFLFRVGMQNTASRALQMSRGTLSRNHHLIVLRFHNWTTHDTARGQRDCRCVLRNSPSVHVIYHSVINTRMNGWVLGKYSNSSVSLTSCYLMMTWHKTPAFINRYLRILY